MASNASDGAGRMNLSILKMRQASSQRTNRPTVNSQGESFSNVQFMAMPKRDTEEERRSSCLAHLGDLGAQLVHDVGEARLEADVELARARQIDRLGQDDVPGPRAHDVDVVGEEGRLAQVVRNQNHGEADLLPEI